MSASPFVSWVEDVGVLLLLALPVVVAADLAASWEDHPVGLPDSASFFISA
jgi:hypothetical protein